MSEHREQIDHPAHYGGKDNPFEAIKVIEAWGLDFHLGNTVKYISRAGKKDGNDLLQDLKKALWYLQRKLESMSGKAEEGKEIPPLVTHDDAHYSEEHHRNITKEEVVAMWLYGEQYSRQGLGIVDFYRKVMTLSQKENCKRMVDDILKANGRIPDSK